MFKEKEHLITDQLGTCYPITFVQVGSMSHVPAPLARISSCGGMTIEVLQEVFDTETPQGRYIAITPQQRRRGSSTGRNLLTMLVSLSGHYAPKSWLAEKLYHPKGEEDDELTWGDMGMVRVDNVITLLRGLLCPPGIDGETALRKALVTFVQNRFESGPGYQLATEPLLWLDIDVIEAAVKQACQREQRGEDALSYWEQAYTLASRGEYLPEERYSDWATDKRREIEAYLRQSVHALHRLYLARDGHAAEERVLLLLRTYWQAHPIDEDIFRLLIELLGKRGNFQEVEAYYHHLCQQLELEGRAPNRSTQEVLQRLHAAQKQQAQATWLLPYPPITSSTSSPSRLLSLKSKNNHHSFHDQTTYSDSVTTSTLASNSTLLKAMIDRRFSKEITYDLLSSNIKTMNFRDEWQYIVTNLVSETKTTLRAMVFDTELTRWWNTIAGQVYMKANMELIRRKIPVKRIFILSSIDIRLRLNTLINAYIHHKLGINVKICSIDDFYNSIPFKPDMFSVHDNMFVALYYFSQEKPITNLLLEDRYILEFSSFYDELFRDERLCSDIESVLAHANVGKDFFSSTQLQLKLLQRLDSIGSVTELARKL